jgi:hypothetical protein
MAKLLKGNPSLNVFIVGHTDNTGAFEHNMKLSMDRATRYRVESFPTPEQLEAMRAAQASRAMA